MLQAIWNNELLNKQLDIQLGLLEENQGWE